MTVNDLFKVFPFDSEDYAIREYDVELGIYRKVVRSYGRYDDYEGWKRYADKKVARIGSRTFSYDGYICPMTVITIEKEV